MADTYDGLYGRTNATLPGTLRTDFVDWFGAAHARPVGTPAPHRQLPADDQQACRTQLRIMLVAMAPGALFREPNT